MYTLCACHLLCLYHTLYRQLIVVLPATIRLGIETCWGSGRRTCICAGRSAERLSAGSVAFGNLWNSNNIRKRYLKLKGMCITSLSCGAYHILVRRISRRRPLCCSFCRPVCYSCRWLEPPPALLAPSPYHHGRFSYCRQIESGHARAP